MERSPLKDSSALLRGEFIIIQTTTNDENIASLISNILLERKLAACIQKYEIESLYRWKNKIEKDREIILNIKTKASLFKEIEKIIRENHNYETPEIIALPIISASSDYLNWLKEELS